MKTKRKGVTKAQMLAAITNIGERQDKIVNWISAINSKLSLVDSVLGIYVDLNGDTDELKKRLEEENKKHQTEVSKSAGELPDDSGHTDTKSDEEE